MISSVIANLASEQTLANEAILEIKSRRGFEVGQLIDGKKLPVTIELPNNNDLEEATQWMQSLEGVEFVDVAFVYLEELN